MQRILVTGASGQLGSYLLRELRDRGASVSAWSGFQTGALLGHMLRPVNLRDADAVAAAFRAARPAVVIHAAAMSAVADCHRDPADATEVNVRGTALLGEFATEAGARLVYVSTDLVFDGERAPYREHDPAAPLSVYGRSKADAEAAILGLPRTTVVRVSLMFGRSLTARPTLLDRQLAALRAGEPLTLYDDEWRTPLDLRTAARALLAIAESDYEGILHLGGPERLSRREMGERLARVLGCNARIVGVSRNSGQPELRPRDVALDSSRWRALFPGQPWPSFEECSKPRDERSESRGSERPPPAGFAALIPRLASAASWRFGRYVS